MSLVATNSTAASPMLIVTVIVSVLAVSAFFGVAAWRLYKTAERAEQEPRYRRRHLLRGALLYAFCAVYGIERVISGNAPIQSLFGLIIPAGLIWFYIKEATRVKLPPA
jgi:hypothetical protein